MAAVDLQRVADLLAEVAATEVVPLFRQLKREDVREKHGGELVTIADVAAEQALERRLLDLLPGSLVVGEEAVAEDPSVLARFAGQEPVWVIDPIDGTGNFSRGNENFALMLALVQAGRTRAGWIFAPVLQRLAVAEEGGGATLDGRPARVAEGNLPVAELTGTLHAGMFSTKEMARHLERQRQHVKQLRSRQSAAIEYLRLVGGEMHFSLFTKLKPWDHAPGCLILAEAGGTARFLDDSEPYTPLRHDGPGLLLAPDEDAWQRLRETLFGTYR